MGVGEEDGKRKTEFKIKMTVKKKRKTGLENVFPSPTRGGRGGKKMTSQPTDGKENVMATITRTTEPAWPVSTDVRIREWRIGVGDRNSQGLEGSLSSNRTIKQSLKRPRPE